MNEIEKDLFFLPAEITKTDTYRIVPIAPDLRKDLEKLDLSKPDYFVFGTYRNHGGLSLNHKTFVPNPYKLTRNFPTRKWKELVKDGLGIQKSLYSNKHKGANDKLVNGISLEAVRDIFGHSDTKTTEIYGKIIKVLRFNEAKEKAGKFI